MNDVLSGKSPAHDRAELWLRAMALGAPLLFIFMTGAIIKWVPIKTGVWMAAQTAPTAADLDTVARAFDYGVTMVWLSLAFFGVSMISGCAGMRTQKGRGHIAVWAALSCLMGMNGAELALLGSQNGSLAAHSLAVELSVRYQAEHPLHMIVLPCKMDGPHAVATTGAEKCRM